MSSRLAEISKELTAIVERVAPSIVRVHGGRRAPASGVVWSPDGVVVTANHVLHRDDDIEITLADGKELAATLVGRDATRDLAALRVETGPLPAPAWPARNDGLEARPGGIVLGLSRPGRAVRVQSGVVSVVAGTWQTPAGGEIEAYLETDLGLHPGFSGGLLVDADGVALGINTAGLLRRASLAVPWSTVKRVVESLVEHGAIRRGYLGIVTYPVRLPADLEEKTGQPAGLMVASVEKASPAAEAGLVFGDVLLSLGGRKLVRVSDLLPLLGEDSIGAERELLLLRAGETREMRLRVAARSGKA
jgi:S1-C subfamily serine protease